MNKFIKNIVFLQKKHFTIFYLFTNIVFLFFISLPLSAKPFQAGQKFATGHNIDFSAVLEGLRGRNITELKKKISYEIDKGFISAFKKRFPASKLKYNHRILGHWGFEGKIPFNQEPYKTVLRKYPKREIIRLWRSSVQKLTKEAIRLTGLPPQQAKSLVALYYNTHLLGDWVPGNTITGPLTVPKNIQKDILKNLRRLFGNNSKFVASIADDIAKLSTTKSAIYADDVLKIIFKHNIGEKIISVWNVPLARNGISYSQNKAIFDFIKATKINSQSKVGKKLIQEVFSINSKNPNQMRKFQQVYNKVKIRKGILQRIKVKGKVVYALSIPIDKSIQLSTALEAGVLTFIFTEGVTIYSFVQGRVTEDKFVIETGKNLITSLASGTAVYVAVALGIGPTGWAILGISAGAYAITDIAFTQIQTYMEDPHFTLNDYLGQLPTAIQRRRTAWTTLNAKTFLDLNCRRQGIYDQPTKKYIYDLNNRKKGIYN